MNEKKSAIYHHPISVFLGNNKHQISNNNIFSGVYGWKNAITWQKAKRQTHKIPIFMIIYYLVTQIYHHFIL